MDFQIPAVKFGTQRHTAQEQYGRRAKSIVASFAGTQYGQSFGEPPLTAKALATIDPLSDFNSYGLGVKKHSRVHD